MFTEKEALKGMVLIGSLMLLGFHAINQWSKSNKRCREARRIYNESQGMPAGDAQREAKEFCAG